MRVAVIGAGSWGTAVAGMTGAHHSVSLWARRPELAEAISSSHANPDYLPDFPLPESVTGTSDLTEAVTDAEVVVMAVPSHGFRQVLSEVSNHLDPAAPIVSLTKGIEQDTMLRMTEVVAEETTTDPSIVGVLTGPNLAREMAAGQPAAAVVAVREENVTLLH